jgi:hypothetical protein
MNATLHQIQGILPSLETRQKLIRSTERMFWDGLGFLLYCFVWVIARIVLVGDASINWVKSDRLHQWMLLGMSLAVAFVPGIFTLMFYLCVSHAQVAHWGHWGAWASWWWSWLV